MKLLLVVLMAVACNAYYAPLLRGKDVVPGSYILRLKDGVSASEGVRKIKDLPILDVLGGTIDRVYSSLGGMAATLTPRALEQIRRLDIIKYVEEDQVVRAQALECWGLDRVDQQEKYDATNLETTFDVCGDGAGVNVYIIDTGILPTHVQFEGRAYTDGTMDFITRGKAQYGIDCHGHGTHCAGTAAGKDYGVARKANLFGVRVLNCQGSGTTSGVLSGMEYVRLNAVAPAVASMSLGGGFSQTENDEVAEMVKAGIPVAVAAGNDNADAMNYSPASADMAITVGASDDQDARASFSNFGAAIDIWAPGVGILSALCDSDTATAAWSGTSMACPHVAGAAAVHLGNNPSMTPQNVKDALQCDATCSCISDAQSDIAHLLYIGKTPTAACA